MARKKKGRKVSGWLVLDKPPEMGSTQAVGKVRRLFDAQKAGHGGTLDPLATGILPIALGEATKTVPYITDGEKVYHYTARWGAQTTTDDSEGETMRESQTRPDEAAINALLPKFTGTVRQVPPIFSAIKIDGQRAYAQARAGKEVRPQAREVHISELSLIECGADEAVFKVICGKGTYIRSLARDMGELLGCFGHVCALRRTFVEPFEEEDAIAMEKLDALEGDLEALDAHLISPLRSMHSYERIQVDGPQASRIRLGNAVILRGRDAPIEARDICAVHADMLLAIGDIERGEFRPRKVFAAH